MLCRALSHQRLALNPSAGLDMDKLLFFLSRVKSILYYPLWTDDGTVFTLFSLFKVLLIFFIGLIVLKFIRRRVEKLLIEEFKILPGAVNSVATLFYYLLLALLMLIALSSAGVNLSQVAIIFGALSVGIGFGLQTIANNFVSGVVLLTERSIKVRDLVQLEDGTLGNVKKINIRSTIVSTFDGLDIIVPNSEFISKKISTWTYGDDWRRIRIPFGVAYGTDPDQVRAVVSHCARAVALTEEDKSHPLVVFFTGFGESSLDFEIAVWIRQSKIKMAITGIKSDYYYALYKALKEADIEIPFPQMDLHLKSLSPDIKKNPIFRDEDL